MFSSLLPKPKYSLDASSIKERLISPARKSEEKSVLQIRQYTGDNKQLIINNPSENSAIKSLHINDDGTVNYNSTIAANLTDSSNVQASYADTIPLKKRYPNLIHHFPRYDLDSCPDESLSICLSETRDIIKKLIDEQNGITDRASSNQPQVIKYKSRSLENEDDLNRGRERTIQISDYKEDPMLPPKFKLRKNRHKNPSPPPPILKKASSVKLTKEEKEKWKIPSAISNWKNNQGFVISLDKRMLAANGGSIMEPQERDLNKLAELNDALEQADKKAREEITIRNEMLKQKAIREQKEKELKLKELAELTRNERLNSNKRSGPSHHSSRKKQKN